MSKTDSTPWLSLESAGERLGLSTRTIRRYVAEGRLPAYRVAKLQTLRVKASDVDALCAPLPIASRGGAR